MSSRPSILLALLALLALGGLGAGAWWLLRRPTQATPAPVLVPRLAPGGVAETPGKTAPLENTAPSEPRPAAGGPPIEVELELVLADTLVAAPGATAPGSAATARLRGSIVSSVNTPVAAEILFEAGPNQGRVLQCDASGKFGAANLYPGRALLRVHGPNIPGSRRVVLLRQKAESELNIGYGRLTEITGEVQSRDNRPLAGAKVNFDGQETTTDEHGVFHFDGVASGQALVVVEMQGYASVQEELTVPAAKKIEKGQLKYVLDKGGRMILEIPDRIRTDVQALCYILEDVPAGTQRRYPWFLVNPVRIWPGGKTTVEDLPAGSFTLRVFQAGAVGKPPQKGARLDAGGQVEVTLNLELAPTIHGLVRLGGQPVKGAEVSLEAADRLGATLAAFGAANEFFVESEIIPDAPPAIQRALSDSTGRFELSSWEAASRERYLVARYDSGRQTATVLLRGGEGEVNLDLRPSAAGDGLLRLELGQRERDMPVHIVVNGEARPAQTLPAGQDLRVGELSRGRWKLNVRYNGSALASEKLVEVGAETALPIELPR